MAGLVTEKVDDFDRTTSLSYAGSVIHFDGGVEMTAHAVWKTADIKAVHFVVMLTRVHDDWRWMKYHPVKFLVDGEPMKISDMKVDTEVLSGGNVYEALPLSLSPEQMVRLTMAKEIRMKIGVDEFTWTPGHMAPLQAVLDGWFSRGADMDPYRELMQKLPQPSEKEQRQAMMQGAQVAMEGKTLAEIEATHGKALSRDAATGWAVWSKFSVRFAGGRVVEVTLP